MARLADYCASSEDELPDIDALLSRHKPNHPKTVSKQIEKSNPGAATAEPKANPAARRVRRLGGPLSQTSGNPLLQRWSIESSDTTTTFQAKPAKRLPAKVRPSSQQSQASQPSAPHQTSDQEPSPPPARSLRARRPRLSPELNDDTEEDGSDSDSTLQSRIRSLQLKRETKPTTTTSVSILEVKSAVPAKDTEVPRKTSRSLNTKLKLSYNLDPEPEVEADDASVYHTAAEDESEYSDAFISDCSHIDSPKRPRKHDLPRMALSENLRLRPVRNTSAASLDTERAKLSKLKPRSHNPDADLADTFSKLQLHLEDFSNDEMDKLQGKELVTPPSTPPRIVQPKGLASPKKAPLIPKTPHRPSSDAFWSQEFVDDWNDQHSPRKVLFTPKVLSPVKDSPRKDAKKAFDVRKHLLAEKFFRELDAEITQGKITQLAESSGGVTIRWTKTLNTTAGRANWKRETIITKQPDGKTQSVRHKHHAAIELAEKVIDDEHRLFNVMAHEFCHLATFMIDGVSNNPHGEHFKAWARQCSRAFSTRGVQVTTKHSYEIDYKYVWQCTACRTEFKRHSKSIDPRRHRCGDCRSTLAQIKPKPRATKGQPSEYQAFVKQHMGTVRLENPGSPQKEVMKIVAERWAKRQTVKL
ncbi:hypothetical protein S40293_05906 [Stachybotrys chartarum IBT 40293]|nr:hypothetical protein S40293_05906 [Stachybotrys chartarum IBT 40293]